MDNDIDQTDADLDYVRGKRKEIIDHYTKKGIPDDIKEVQTLLVALSDMDRASLSKKKIKVDKDTGSNQINAMNMLAHIFTNANLKNINKSDTPTDRSAPVIDTDIDVNTIINGETSPLGVNENYDSFMARVS